MKGISYRKLIDEKCKDCTYDKYGEGNWKQQTGDCTVESCPLWPVRPKSKPRSEKTRKYGHESGLNGEI